ncbi:Rrf2 family transcriptional regulator [Vagococcus coleopterorum]|uniref:Rrf2 family transcriptional regulator n=1 Tax=Vagococcus coleopterorum TaxID=2714946 RepID=A0A6G8AP69_9ENTE|nr:Rrf2 family transcriptional regulator [Vagococcus coleopterorum]QIL46796.1 Rrf2 family transcriptional regulator [Vagococcus coleopterorum]
MAFSTKVSVATHILTLIYLEGEKGITSDEIAGSIQTNPALVRKLLSQLKKGGLIESSPGPVPTRLASKPEDMTLYQIYMAVEAPRDIFLLHEDTSQECIVGRNIQESLKGYVGQIEDRLNEELKTITLADVIKNIAKFEKEKISNN